MACSRSPPISRTRVPTGIQGVTDDLIDKMLAGPSPADLVQALSLPLPSLMICDLLGVLYADHDFFQVHAQVATARNVTAEVSAQSFAELSAYLGKLITAKMDAPAEDVLSDLGARVRDGELSLADAATMGLIMLIAGHETSANMITLSTALLLENPDQLALLRETQDPKVVANAVEELLRHLTVPHLGQRRIAVEDIEIDGETIRAGEGIIAPLPAANWDPVAFPWRFTRLWHSRATDHLVVQPERTSRQPHSLDRLGGPGPVGATGDYGFEIQLPK